MLSPCTIFADKIRNIAMRNNFLDSIPPVTRHLIITNVVVWLISCFLLYTQNFDLDRYLGLHYFGASDFNPAQLITYMFMHDNHGIAHIFFNMFSLYMFGRLLEQVLGGKRFLFFYISTGIGAALIQEGVIALTWMQELAHALNVPYDQAMAFLNDPASVGASISQRDMLVNQFLNQMVTVGASGAVFGILIAFAMVFPNLPLYLFFIPVPIKAKYMVIGYGLLELVFGVSGTMAGVAHFAHLGGMLFGFLIIWYWKKKGVIGGGFYY